MPITIGQSIGRYHILERLGQGGMATVFKAYDMRLDRDVAIKFIRTDQVTPANLDNSLKRFEREAKALGRLNHPNIVRVHDFGEHANVPYLVMEYVPGGTLKARFDGKSIPYAEAITLLLPVARALVYAHSLSVIHRDVKPANILMTASGEPMLSDFGVAKILQVEELTLTGAGVGIGTPEYMAPEQWMGKAGMPADIYALGVVLYELLTGKKPYTADTPAAILLKQMIEPLPSPSEYVKGLPVEVERVLFKALAKDPQERYTTMAEFATVLEQILALPAADGVERKKEHPVQPIAALPSLAGAGISQNTISDETLFSTPKGQKSGTPAIAKNKLETESHKLPTIRHRVDLHRMPVGWLIGAVTLAVMILILLIVGTSLGWWWLNRPTPLAVMQASSTPRSGTASQEQTLKPLRTLTPNISNTRTLSLDAIITPESTLSPLPGASLTPVMQKETLVPPSGEIISGQNARQVAELKRWGKGTIKQIVYSPDGNWIGVASSIGVYLFDSKTLKEAKLIQNQRMPVSSLAFSSDGSTLAAAWGKIIQVWPVSNISDNSLISTIYPTYWINCIALSADGTILASGSDDKTVKLWAVASGNLISTLNGHTNQIQSVAFSPDGTILASASDDKTVKLWRVADGSLISTLNGHLDRVNSIAFSPDGATLASGSADKTVKLWRVADGSLVSTLDGFTSLVLSIAFAPDGGTLASGQGDNTVRLVRVSDGSLISTFDGFMVAYSPDGATLAIATYGKSADNFQTSTLDIRQVADGKLLASQDGFTSRVLSVAFSPDGATLAIGMEQKMMLQRKVADGSLINIISTYGEFEGRVTSVAYSPDGTILAAGSSEGSLKLWRVADGSLLFTLRGQSGITSVAFSPDGTILACGAADTTVWFWRVADGSLINKLQKHTDKVLSIAFSPDGTVLASGSADRTVKLWRVADGSLISSIEGDADQIYSIAFSPDGSTLAGGSSDTNVRLWRVSDGSLISTLKGHEWGVNSVAFSPDGTLLASGSVDFTVKLWRVSDGRLINSLAGHVYWVNSVAFSPDGTLLASSSDDGTVRLWGVP